MVIDGKSEQQRNPAYTAWVARDQAVLGYIMSTLTHETSSHLTVSYCCRGQEDPCCPLRVTDARVVCQHKDRPHHDEKEPDDGNG
jgi:hypothetical protein